ncbi:MAG: M56 family metallopeptidase [Nannocystis sp.]|nr:M56 family metallopeptidase [Nannocystis sp.]
MQRMIATLLSTSGLPWWLGVGLKACLVLAAAWLVASLLRRSAAAARHRVWTLGVVGALSMPLLCWASPSLLAWSPPLLVGRGVVAGATVVTGAGGSTLSGSPASALIGLLWLTGAFFVGLRVARGHRAAWWQWRQAAPLSTPAWSAAVDDTARSLGLRAGIPIGASAAIRSPMTIGVLRPRVLLPEAAASWSPRRLRAVLLHELGHVRRRDPLIQLAAQILCALYWWNPLAWLAAARLRAEREFACDDLVLEAGIRPSSYAADLLEVARGLGSPVEAAIGAVSMSEPSGTEARLRRILDADARRRPLGAAWRAVAGSAALSLSGALAVLVAPRVEPPLLASVDEDMSGAGAPEPAALRLRASLTVGDLFISSGEPGPFAIQEGIDLSLVAREVERHRGELHACYQRRLAVDPALAGEVIIHAGIDRHGAVTEQCITSTTIEDRELLTCVNALLAAASFPGADDETVDVSFPFVFEPG